MKLSFLGLDPVNPKFYPLGCYLTSNDANWVDVIHTDMGGSGTSERCGTTDYYPNDGTRTQPGCSTKILSKPGKNQNN